jgi:hypothetical protein
MLRLACPNCGLSISVRAVAPIYCPRCLVRRGRAVELVTKSVSRAAHTPASGADTCEPATVSDEAALTPPED